MIKSTFPYRLVTFDLTRMFSSPKPTHAAKMEPTNYCKWPLTMASEMARGFETFEALTKAGADVQPAFASSFPECRFVRSTFYSVCGQWNKLDSKRKKEMRSSKQTWSEEVASNK